MILLVLQRLEIYNVLNGRSAHLYLNYLSRGRDRKRSDFITDQDVLPCALAINLWKWQADAHLTITKLRLTNNCLTLNIRLVTPAEILKLMSNPFGCIEQHMSVWGKYSIYYLFFHEYFILYINGLSYLIFIFRLGLLISLQCNKGQVCFESLNLEIVSSRQEHWYKRRWIFHVSFLAKSGKFNIIKIQTQNMNVLATFSVLL